MINTRRLQVSADNPEKGAIAEAVEVLKEGGLVAFPTETVYGLGANAFDSIAIRKVFQAKGRPSDNPLIVHIAELSFLKSLVTSLPDLGKRLAHEFWPGPLTLVLNRTPQVPDIVTAGLETVAVRMPNHPVALSLLAELGSGIVAPSANISGRPSPTTAQHVWDDLAGKIDMILDSGPTSIGVESTVLDITVSPPVILRKGGTSREAIENVIGAIRSDPDDLLAKRSPGTRYKHYAPQARVLLVHKGDQDGLMKVLRDPILSRKKIGCLLHSIPEPVSARGVLFRRAPAEIGLYSRALFGELRMFDSVGMEIVVVEEVSEGGLGAAIMDRLRRAAAPVIKK